MSKARAGVGDRRGQLLLFGVRIPAGRGDYLSSEKNYSADISVSLGPARPIAGC